MNHCLIENLKRITSCGIKSLFTVNISNKLCERVEVTNLNVTTRVMTECCHDHRLQLKRDLARLPVLGLEHVALLP